jgi:hypothetical protein
MSRVIVEVLSDHPGDELRRIDTAHEAQLLRVKQHQTAVEDLRDRQRSSRRWWQISTRLAQWQEMRALKMRAPIVDRGVDRDRARQMAGISAEQEMTAALHRLSDDWRLFRGYANRRGEVDHLLVGPGGVWAIEVKRRAVRVHIDGDRWSFEKFDRYGNLVDRGILADRGGRSWGRQVTDIARELERFLTSRQQPVKVRTAVVLLHERGQLGSHRNLHIDLFTVGPDDLLQRLRAAPLTLDRSRCDAVSRLVRRDHTFHAQRRTARGGSRR